MRVNRELLDWEVRISSELASVDIFESVDIVEHWYHGDNTSEDWFNHIVCFCPDSFEQLVLIR